LVSFNTRPIGRCCRDVRRKIRHRRRCAVRAADTRPCRYCR
jgi:hypothetical protein